MYIGKRGWREGGEEGRREWVPSLLQGEQSKAHVGYYLSRSAVDSAPLLEVYHCLGQFDEHISYVLNEQYEQAYVMKPGDGEEAQ